MELKNKVIFINDVKQEEPVIFTHLQWANEGWKLDDDKPVDFDKVFYLGNCKIDGDMFAAFKKNTISIYKGHLNSGKY